MKKTIIDLITIAEQTEDVDIANAILKDVAYLIYTLADTINCPSNWRNITEELAEEYKDNIYIYEALDLWNYQTED